MNTTDPIADFLTRIRNAMRARHKRVDIPASNMKRELSRILLEQKFISGFSEIKDNKQGVLRVTLKYTDGRNAISGLDRVSKPGLRVYAAADELPRVLNGMGIAVISTSKGIMTDKEARERVDKLNQADSFVFQTEKQLKDLGEKIPADKKAPIETALAKLKEAQKSQDIAKIDAAIAEINTAWTAASEHIYKGTQENGPQSGSESSTNGNDQSNAGKNTENVTDAEFEEVK